MTKEEFGYLCPDKQRSSWWSWMRKEGVGCPACQSYLAHLSRCDIYLTEDTCPAGTHTQYPLGEDMPFFRRRCSGPSTEVLGGHPFTIPPHPVWECIACGRAFMTPRQAKQYALAREVGLQEQRGQLIYTRFKGGKYGNG